jgi:hypothetical protein
MSPVGTFFGREPVTVLTLVQTFVALLVGFGVHLTGDQVALVTGFSGALIGFVIRTQVVPVAVLPDHIAAAVVIAQNAAIQPKIPIEAISAPSTSQAP